MEESEDWLSWKHLLWLGWLSWTSPLYPVWLWHVLFDGTRACPCERSRRWRGALALLTTENPADWPWWGWEGGEA